MFARHLKSSGKKLIKQELLSDLLPGAWAPYIPGFSGCDGGGFRGGGTWRNPASTLA